MQDEQQEIASSGGKYAVLRRSDFQAALAKANDIASTKRLYDQVATMEELAKRLKVTLDEENRIAEVRIEVARKLGGLLRKTVHRGGIGSNSQRGSSIERGGSSSPLPEGITWNMSSRLQTLAAIPDGDVDLYIAEQRERHELITMAGLLRIARGHKRPKRKRRAGEELIRVGSGWPGVLEAVSRVADIDICVGLEPPKSWKNANGCGSCIEQHWSCGDFHGAASGCVELMHCLIPPVAESEGA